MIMLDYGSPAGYHYHDARTYIPLLDRVDDEFFVWEAE